jgi:hypothetical protein
VDLPGTFCSAVRMPANGTVYMRAHAMIQPPGQISATEASIAVENATGGPGIATTIDWDGPVPTSAAAGSNFTVCWRVEGTGTVPHTAIHTDDESHAGDATATFADYDKATYYPGNATGQVAVDLPGTFCTSVQVPDTAGNLYLRAHVIDSTGAPGRMSLTEKAVAISV